MSNGKFARPSGDKPQPPLRRVGGAQDGVEVVRVAEFDRSGVQRGHPHTLVGRAMGADDRKVVEHPRAAV